MAEKLSLHFGMKEAIQLLTAFHEHAHSAGLFGGVSGTVPIESHHRSNLWVPFGCNGLTFCLGSNCEHRKEKEAHGYCEVEHPLKHFCWKW